MISKLLLSFKHFLPLKCETYCIYLTSVKFCLVISFLELKESEARRITHSRIVRQLSWESLSLPPPLNQRHENLLFPSSQMAVSAVGNRALVASRSLSESDMLHPADYITPNLNPIDTRVQLFIHEPTNGYIFSSYDIEAVSYLGAGLGIIERAYDALNSLA